MLVLPPERRVDINKSLDNIELFDGTKKKTTEEFYNSLPPDAKFQFFEDGTSGFVDGRGNKYTPPPSIDDRPRNVSSNTNIIEYDRFNPPTSNTSLYNVKQDNQTIESSTTSESGSDFLTNVGGAGATTFDYDLSEADLLEAIELRKAAYGDNVQIQTSSTINADGEEEKTFLERTGDRLYEIFVSGPMSVETRSSPVSGKTVATKVPGIGGVMDAATMFSPIPGVGTLMNKMGDRLVDAQASDTRAAVVGMRGYGSVQVQEKSTGRIIDLTTSPAFGKGLDQSANRTAFMNALGITDNTSVGTYAESDVQGPVIFNGIEYPNIDAVIRVVSQKGYVSPFAMETNIPAGEDYDRSRVVGAGEKRIGLYDEDSGEVNLGFGRTGAVTGVAIDATGNLNYKTDGSGFIMGMGEMVNTGTGIAFSGSRANIAGANALSQAEAQNLLNRINTGEITSTPNTTAFLQKIGNPNYNTYGDDNFKLDPPFNPIPEFGSYPIPPIERSDVIETELGGGGIKYEGPGGGYSFSETPFSDVYSEGNIYEEDDVYSEGTIPDFSPPVSDAFYDSSNESNEGSGKRSVSDSVDTGLGSFDAYTAKGGRIGKQEGGVANQQGVSQIVQGAGFIAPQGNATEQQTIADDIPMEAEEGDFIINAPAAQFAGRQDIVDMIVKAIESLREKGIDIQYGNPTIPVERSVKLAVSRNEVYVPKAIAEEIGYDKLQKINNRGKREVERRQQESQKQASRGGFIKKADGDVVSSDETLKDDKSSILGTDEGSFINDLGRAIYNSIKESVSGFISPKEKEKQELQQLEKPPLPKPKPEIKQPKQKSFIDPMKKIGLEFPENSEKGRTYSLLTLLETLPDQDTRIGYVPKGGSGDHTSGVTVGLGFDIGQHSAQDLLKYKFSKSLYERLLPYAGKKLDDARAFIAQNPLNLTDEELSEINIKGILDVNMREFEKQFPEFKDVPTEDKAVLYSAYHVGGLRPDGILKGKRIKRTPENPKAVRYGKFYKIYKDSGSIQNALRGGVLDIIKKGGGEWNRADKANTWVEKIQRKFMGTPKPRPSSIKPRPQGTSNPTSSFINSPTMG